jgi:hypothetical protein
VIFAKRHARQAPARTVYLKRHAAAIRTDRTIDDDYVYLGLMILIPPIRPRHYSNLMMILLIDFTNAKFDSNFRTFGRISLLAHDLYIIIAPHANIV